MNGEYIQFGLNRIAQAMKTYAMVEAAKIVLDEKRYPQDQDVTKLAKTAIYKILEEASK